MGSRSRRLVSVISGLALSPWVLASLTLSSQRQPEPRLSINPQPFAPTPPQSPCEKALRQARWWQLRAVQRVNEEREALEAAALEPVPGNLLEAWWRQLMARDRSGHLHRARVAARRAATLARTREEKFHVALVLTRLACYAGHHREELRLARRLIALEPEHESAVQALRRAAACLGVELLSPRPDPPARPE